MGARHNGLADVFVEWAGRAPDDHRSVLEIQDAGCFDLHGLHWQESFVAREGRRRICHYRAPDAESVRIAFRQGGIEVDAVWSGAMIGAGNGAAADLVIERPFEPPLPADARDAVLRAEREWLAPLGIELVRAIVPAGRGRIICFCGARAARDLPVPAWSCRHVAP